jgi:hypothetical protein
MNVAVFLHFMNGESVLVLMLLLYYICVDLICIFANHVYVFVIEQTHTVNQSGMVMPVLKS